MTQMKTLHEILEGQLHIGITGHQKPDGDCVGSTLALYYYLKNNYPSLDIDVFLERIPDEFRFLDGWEVAKNRVEDKQYDVFFALDCGDKGRIALGREQYDKASKRINIDHHISNPCFGDENYLEPDASSTSELIFRVIEEDGGVPDTRIASWLYLGIIQDTGVFQYDCTSPVTMEVAADLIRYDVPFSRIIRETFYEKTLTQQRLLGEVLVNARMEFDDRVITGVVTDEIMRKYGGKLTDLEGIVSLLNLTKGIDVAIFFYQTKPDEFKVSVRTSRKVDATAIVTQFGGGGHRQAAGASVNGNYDDIIERVLQVVGTLL